MTGVIKEADRRLCSKKWKGAWSGEIERGRRWQKEERRKRLRQCGGNLESGSWEKWCRGFSNRLI